MSRLGWLDWLRTQQLLTAAAAGELRYDSRGGLTHATSWGHQPASTKDAGIVADLIRIRWLGRDESGAITPIERADAS